MRSFKYDQPISGRQLLKTLHRLSTMSIPFAVKVSEARWYHIGGACYGGHSKIWKTIWVAGNITIGELELESGGVSLNVEEWVGDVGWWDS